jgi:hypothetical protein
MIQQSANARRCGGFTGDRVSEDAAIAEFWNENMLCVGGKFRGMRRIVELNGGGNIQLNGILKTCEKSGSEVDIELVVYSRDALQACP